MKPELKIEYGPAGKCPVQAEGTINGHRFYFRARGAYWSIRVCSKAGDNLEPLADKFAWYYREEYKGVNRHRDDEINDGAVYAAGFAEDDECVEAIQRFAEIWAQQHNKEGGR